jgi:hypothetical protein
MGCFINPDISQIIVKTKIDFLQLSHMKISHRNHILKRFKLFKHDTQIIF